MLPDVRRGQRGGGGMTAFTAKTPAQRATVALELLCRTTTGDMGREFSACVEMGDGDDVVREGLKKLRRRGNRRYRDAVRKWGGITDWQKEVNSAYCLFIDGLPGWVEAREAGR
jgi:hypothetical protein